MKKEDKSLSYLNFLHRIYRFDEIDSTNEKAKELIRDNKIIFPSVLIASSQVAGYGRFERNWQSPPGGLYFSLVLKKEFSPGGLPLFVGICIARAFKSFAGVDVMIKWPNDLIYEEAKIAGILTEIVSEKVIIGCGINTFDNTTLEEMNIPGTINYTLAPDEREKLLYEIVKVFSEAIPVFYHEGFSPFKEEWKLLSYCLNKKINFNTPKGDFDGVVKDVTSNGGIIIQTGDDIKAYYSGEVSVKRIYGQA